MRPSGPGDGPGPPVVRDHLRALLEAGDLDLPLPGGGSTPRRHRALLELARTRAVALARLAEAHTDAVAIWHEAGGRPRARALYGVWAAESAGDEVVYDRDRGTIGGTKPFCSGLGIVDRALVTAVDHAGIPHLVDVAVPPDARAGTVAADTGNWHTPALAATATGRSAFADHPVDDVVGRPGFYLDRPGFWHGALGPAACWAGAAIGLADAAESLTGDDPHRLAHLGALRALRWQLHAVLDQAGSQIDGNPHDARAARHRALVARHLVERACAELLDRFSRSLGPRPFVGRADLAQRYADTHLYLRQHHAERDLQALAELPDDG